MTNMQIRGVEISLNELFLTLKGYNWNNRIYVISLRFILEFY